MKPGKYGWSHNGKGLVPVPAEQTNIRLMRAMESASESYQAIANALNRRGSLTRTGKPWTNNAVGTVLRQIDT